MTATSILQCKLLLVRWRSAAAAGALGLLLSGCAALAPPPSPEPLLQDALFGQPPRPAAADQVLALSEPMQAHLRSLLQRGARSADLPAALADSLYGSGELRLDYDAGFTRNAAQAFEARAGNCLSLVLMTAALARELGLEVHFQSARLDELLSREADLTLRSGHVNLMLGAPQRRSWDQFAVNFERERLQIDFLPPEELRGLRTEPIDLRRVLAMYMNNRAVETLLERRSAEAYAWAREAVRQDPGFWAAYNTLGVVYQRAGQLAPAAAAFNRVLAQDSRNVAAMGNLVQVLQAQGRADEATRWTARLEALQPWPPFHFLQLGQAAMDAGEFGKARGLFLRELRSSGPSHESYFWLARAHLALGEPASAQRALRRAMDTSTTPGQQARYGGKLDALRVLMQE
jgi:tetratricopeptide (TPR) repeat protein